MRTFQRHGAVLLALLLNFSALGTTPSLGQATPPGPSTAEDLPAPGYCPLTATDPSCPAKLEEYRTTYRTLLEKTDSYYATLGEAFGSSRWTEAVSSQTATLVDGFARVTSALDLKLTDLKINRYVTALQSALGKKKDYEAAREAWLKDPLTKANATALDAARTAYFAALREAYALADGYSGYGDQLKPVVAAAESITTALKDLKSKVTAPADLGNFAGVMRDTLQQQSAAIEAAYDTAKKAAEAAVRAGAKLEKKPESAGEIGNVRIVDALYGDSQLMRQVYEAWLKSDKKGRLRDFIPRDALGKPREEVAGAYCQAADYVRASCEFAEVRAKVCLHKEALTKPERANDASYCEGDYTIAPTDKLRVVKKPQSTCSLVVQPDVICGGFELRVPAPARHALILFRCGSGDAALRPAPSNKRIYLFCE